MRPVTLKGERITLRPLRISDAKLLMPYVNDRVMTRYLSWSPPFTLKKEIEFVRKTARGWRNGIQFVWAITLKTDGKLIGTIGFHRVSKQHSKAEMGIWIARDYHGQGIGTEAGRMALDFIFKRVRLNRIEYKLFKPNIASRKLIEKLGGRREGLLREAVRKGKVCYDVYIYSILRREWKK